MLTPARFYSSWDSGVIYSVALAMQIGVKIPDQDMRLVRDLLPDADMTDKAREQMQEALDDSTNNGEPLELQSEPEWDVFGAYFRGRSEWLWCDGGEIDG